MPGFAMIRDVFGWMLLGGLGILGVMAGIGVAAAFASALRARDWILIGIFLAFGMTAVGLVGLAWMAY